MDAPAHGAALGNGARAAKAAKAAKATRTANASGTAQAAQAVPAAEAAQAAQAATRLSRPWPCPWPLPALAAWLAAWALLWLLRGAGCGMATALLAGQGLGLVLAWRLRSPGRWRRLIVAAGFPLSALGSGLAAGMPGWLWLLPLALLLLAYPLRAWRDAPLFPTPPAALAGAAAHAVLPPAARVLDAGCGLGHGLAALRAEWPQARLEGVEWSWPLRLAAALRCPWARVRRGDMWAADWSGCALVYLFQRPESMARAWAKANAEMAPGSWLASLEFSVPGVAAQAAVQRPGAQPVWLYRVGQAPSPPDPAGPPWHAGVQSSRQVADNPH